MNEFVEAAVVETLEMDRKTWSDPVLQEYDVNEVTALDPTVSFDAPFGVS